MPLLTGRGGTVDFDTFFAKSCPEMLARAMLLARNRHDAEDAVQEAYVEALSRWDRISHYDNPGAWVYKLVRQRLWKSAKRWTRLRSLTEDDTRARVAVDGDPERFTEAVMALSALAGLPDRQRMVMVMHCLHRMEQQQIADELGLTRGAVAASIFKARRKLEKTLGLKETEVATAGNAITEPEAAAISSPAIPRQDPLAAWLDVLRSGLRHLTSDERSQRWLDRVHREAHARTGESQ